MPKNYQKVLEEVLKRITPDLNEKKKLIDLSKKVLVVAEIEAKKIKAKVMLAGSITRDTWLPGKREFDIFILFPAEMSEKQLEDQGLKIGKDIMAKVGGSFRIEYAQHPYVCGCVQDVDVDIVPCFDVESPEKMKSAVDRTPFHVEYIEKNLPLKLSSEVRLLKQFLTANGMYGADAKTQGFSGYVCELVVIQYKKFLDVLKAAEEWKPGEVVDIKGFYTKKDFHKLRKDFKDQALVLIDPTDKTRNTAAALSGQNFFKFKKIAKDFLSRPSTAMFFQRTVEPITENDIVIKQMLRRAELILVKFTPPDVVPDILWPQLRKFSERLESIMEENEFVVLRKGEYSNERDLAVVLLEMEVSKLPTVQKRIGPKVFDLDDSQRFLAKYAKQALAGPFVENNFWCVEVKRNFLTAREKLVNSLKESSDILKAKGIPNAIADQLPKGFEIICENEKIMKLVKQDENFGVFLKKYFEMESLI